MKRASRIEDAPPRLDVGRGFEFECGLGFKVRLRGETLCLDWMQVEACHGVLCRSQGAAASKWKWNGIWQTEKRRDKTLTIAPLCFEYIPCAGAEAECVGQLASGDRRAHARGRFPFLA